MGDCQRCIYAIRFSRRPWMAVCQKTGRTRLEASSCDVPEAAMDQWIMPSS